MKKIELKEYPLSTELIKEWYIEKMLESFKDKTVPEEFKQMMLDQGVEIDKIETLININPHSLFEFFDEKEIYIFIHYMETKKGVEFFYSIKNMDINPVVLDKTRREAELFGVSTALDIYENKLKLIEFPVL